LLLATASFRHADPDEHEVDGSHRLVVVGAVQPEATGRGAKGTVNPLCINARAMRTAIVRIFYLADTFQVTDDPGVTEEEELLQT